MSQDILKNRDIIIEFFPLGNLVKVSAMDVTSMTEISIQGPASASQKILKANALKRLAYVLKKKGIV